MGRGISGAPRGLDPSVLRLLENLKETLEVGEGQRGKEPLKRYVKLQDLIDMDLAQLIRITPGGVIPGRDIVNPNAPNTNRPPVPTGFEVRGGFSHVFLSWDTPRERYSNHARTLVYRATEDNVANAQIVGTSTSFAYPDLDVLYGVTYYYWIRWESSAGIMGPFNSTVGTPGARAQDPSDLLDMLSGQITESHLYQVLNDRINLIDAPDTGLIYQIADETQSRIEDFQALNQALEAETQARLADILSVLNQLGAAEDRILANETHLVSLQASVDLIEQDVSGGSQALSLLDARVTENEGSITAQGTSITQLQAGLTSAQNDISGNANAVSALDSRVTVNEGDIISQSSEITQLSSDIQSLNTDTAALSTALSSLDTRVTQNETSITAQSVELTSLSSGLTALEGDVSANSGAISTLSTRVTTTENQISSISSDLTDLEAYVNTIDAEGNAAAISALDARVTSNESSITSQGSSITSLQNSVNSLQLDVSGNSSAISSLTTDVTAVEGDITAISSDLTQLQSDVTNAQNTANSAASAASALDTRVTANENSISSQSTQITELISDVNLAENNIAGNSASIATLDSRVTANEGDILSQGSSITSLQNSLTNLDTDVSANSTALTSLESEVTLINGELSSQASSITQISSDLDGNISMVEEMSLVVDGLEAQWSVKTQVNDLVGGVGLYNDGTSVQFLASVDSFGIIAPGADTLQFFVENGKVVMDAASIVNLVVTDAIIDSVSATKITGLDAEFIEARIENLTADKISGDVNKVYPTESTIPVDIGNSRYRFRRSVNINIESQTRPRWPLVFSRMGIRKSSSGSFRLTIGFFQLANAGASPVATLGSWGVYASSDSLVRSVSVDTGDPAPPDPDGWDSVEAGGQIVTVEPGGLSRIFQITGKSTGSSSAGPGTTVYVWEIHFSWMLVMGSTSETDPISAGASLYSSAAVPYLKRYESVLDLNTGSDWYRELSSYVMIQDKTSDAKSYYVALSGNQPAECEYSRIDVLMAR